MALRSICALPDPVLQVKTRRVREIDASLQHLIDDMIDTMREAFGVGLAANQVGVPLRVCVIEVPEEEVRVLINPEIIVRQGERELEEGCLSIPGYRGQVTRSRVVRVRALDRRGKPIRIKAEDDLLAQALEHELGHLNGDLYINHLVSKGAIWKITQEETPGEARASEGVSPHAAAGSDTAAS